MILCFQENSICHKEKNKDLENSTYKSKRYNIQLKCSAPYEYECGDELCSLNAENCEFLRIFNSYLALQFTRPKMNKKMMAKITRKISNIKKCSRT